MSPATPSGFIPFELCVAKCIGALQYCVVSAGETSILIIDQSEDRGLVIAQGLIEGGYHNVSRVSRVAGLAAEIEKRNPDIIVMDLGNPQRDFLEHMFSLTRVLRRPIAMFVDQSSDEALLEAMEAGVSAYVVDGLRKERVKPILDLAIARFRTFDRLRAERDQAVAELEERKLIEKAKGLLMQHEGLTEEAAHVRLRSEAMDRAIPMSAVARHLIARLRPSGSKNGNKTGQRP